MGGRGPLPVIPVDVFARTVLLPVLAVQGIVVRRRALILPEPEGARAGGLGAGPDLRILIVGDSSGAGVGANTQSEALAGQLASDLAADFRVTWRLVARTGASTVEALAMLSEVGEETFDVAILALGVNDVTGAVTRARWVAQQQRLFQELAGRFGVTRIYASGLPPMGLFPLLPQPLRWILGAQATRLDAALAGMAAQSPLVCHVPFNLPHEARYFADDGYHPSPPAYALWAGILANLIRRDHPHGNFER